MLIDTLMAISPIDGRYRKRVEKLAEYFSEYGLIKHRLMGMLAYIDMLTLIPGFPLRQFTTGERTHLYKRVRGLTLEDAQYIKDIETKGTDRHKRTNHDVKACELWLRDLFMSLGMHEFVEFVHIGRTSEDVNNVAYAMLMQGAVTTVILPAIYDIEIALRTMAHRYAVLPMLSRTHGQPATPTTLGKELAVFLSRLCAQKQQLADFRMKVKLNGASGNYAADVAAFPHVDWLALSQKYVQHLNVICVGDVFELNALTTQIEPHDTYAELFGILSRINTILIGFAQDVWSYVSEEWIVQKPDGVGSSTMPHKVNPIDFENAEGNFVIANALFGCFSAKLPISRRQRDLSDSTVQRVFGTAFGHALVAFLSITTGLGKISANEAQIRADLDAHPEILAEAYQTILRSVGFPEGYTTLKDFTQGKRVTMDDMHAFVASLEGKVPDDVRGRMLEIRPSTYIGLATQLARMAADGVH